MALREKLIACGPKLTVFGMVLKFIAGPAAMAIGSIVAGLRGDVLRVSIIQVTILYSFILLKMYTSCPNFANLVTENVFQ